MRVLVTGGAGYIGSHVVRQLLARESEVVVVDDLVTGDERRIPGVPVVRADLADTAEMPRLVRALDGVDAVIHFAARKRVDESVLRPEWYYRQNVGGMANLLSAMESAGVDAMVFSSSAAVYGTSEGASIPESAPTEPISPYGQTKLIGERMLTDVAAARAFRSASLRYFNVAGAGSPELGDTAVLNLVPMVFEKLDAGKSPVIFGDDYPTPDGTCIRDYIHVSDLAAAHVAALDAIVEGRIEGNRAYNIGTGAGSSVREMMSAIAEASGIRIEPRIAPRRDGDAAVVVADPSRARDELGWSATRGLRDIVMSAWRSHELLVAGAHG
ncbi:UDP-glucose 4-epimerase GalE [Leifsonia sp. 21MFCrub1.1]|uniref:UDP-glucose 4-epimerase GalE n=1 Tax=Leifsonia sp. 21MFCrub1.1 TaxID=1798223 RepID=UPI000892A527|nr:UDP-glucose 4-epimerase GalE [Leifsonia sp. 21MFCrub1.1]SEB00391.1 UDP-glucose 4-epimerase [Leifsonia sp. 21MFCrub1.1]